MAILPIEAVAIASRLLEAASTDGSRRDRVIAAATDIAGLDGPARRRAGIACPFLASDGRCDIHDARPLRCRGLHSRDAAQCARPNPHEPDDGVFPLVPLHLADAALTGLAEACASHGVPTVARELTLAIAALLRRPDRLEAVMTGIDPIEEACLPGPPADVAAP